MKNFIYPAVVLYDDESKIFTMYFPDLTLVAEGDSVEDVFFNGKKYLNTYMELIVREGLELDPPSAYETIKQEYPKDLIVFVECVLNDKNKAV